MTETTKNWSDESVATLLSTVGTSTPVTADLVTKAAELLGKSTRSVASKLRSLDMEVASMAVVKPAAFTESEGVALRDFVQGNAGVFTYKEIAENFMGGKFTAKQVQGKVLALELTGSVKATEKVVAARTYSEAEEAKFINLASAGAFIEDIATALGKEINSIRGKALSLMKNGAIKTIPAQKNSHAKAEADPVDALGDKLATMTVAEIAKATEKTERGIKTLLTRRGINVADYKGADKAAKNAEKATVAA